MALTGSEWRVLDPHPVHSLADYEAAGGGAALASARQVEPRAIVDVIAASGLRGRGGAGFPTGRKWETVLTYSSPEEPTPVVINAAEGEPGTFKDRALLRTNPYRVLEGALIAAVAIGSDEIRIGTKARFGREIQRLRQAIDEMEARGWLDGVSVRLVLGPSHYLFGEETGLLEVMEGRQPFPRVTPPYRRGIEERDGRSAAGVDLAAPGGTEEPPALVNNVETLAHVPGIVQNGPEWFREVGTEQSPGTLVCTVTGDTRRSGVGEVPMGTPLGEVIERIGWGLPADRRISTIVAGTANALIPESLLDTPLTYEAMRAAGTGLGSAGFIVFDDRTDPVSVAAAVSHFLAVESCGQCEPCKRDGMALAEHLEQLRGSMLDEFGYSDLLSRLDTVEDGQRCNLASQQTAVVGSLLRLYAPNVRQHREAEAAAPGSLVSNPVAIAPIDNIVGGRLVLDASELTKQPDWSHDETWSGAVPAALLGDTPVHIEAPTSSRRWPEWESQFDDRHPLEVIDSSHEELDRLIHDAMGSGPDARMTAGQRLEHAVRLHVDVTRRILTFMARRHGGDQGEEIADATELKGVHVLELLDEVDAAGDDEARWRDAVREVGVALHDFGAKEDEMLELLRHTMDPQERAELGDALAEGIATSTVP